MDGEEEMGCAATKLSGRIHHAKRVAAIGSVAKVIVPAVFCLTVWLLGAERLGAQESGAAAEPNWIWHSGAAPQKVAYFRRAFDFQANDEACQLEVLADDEFTLFVNGRMAARGEGWRDWRTVNLSRFVRRGGNVLALEVRNTQGGTAGLAARLTTRSREGAVRVVVTDVAWKSSLQSALNWNQPDYSDQKWLASSVLGQVDLGQPPAAQKALAATAQQPKSPTSTTSPSAAALTNKDASANEPTAKELSGKQPGTAGPSPKRPAVLEPGTKPLSVQRKSDAKFRLAREFRLEHLADHASLGSIIAMTFDEFGQLLISQEEGPLLVCLPNEAGVFDRTRVYSDQVKGCQGLLCLNGNVYAVGRGPDGGGLYRLSDTDQDGDADQVVRLVELTDKMLEHGPHAIVLGPDGLLYVLLGNHTALPKNVALTSSPYQHPYEGDLVSRWWDPGGHADGIMAPGGVVLRMDIDAKRIELVTGGLRNPYDLVFNVDGELFTHDADMESDRNTPWYRPTRVLQLTDGGEYGWRAGWSKWPEYYLDSLPSLADTGRGSPTGSTVYEHTSFPDRYRGALFLADWSEGRILVARLKNAGASYQATVEPFMEGEPLNVTDLEVGPDGALYIVTGGRGTAGNLYRVSWRGTPSQPEPSATAGIRRALTQPQPQSAWGRQAIAELQSELGSRWEEMVETVCLSSQRPAAERVRGLRLLRWFGPEPSHDLLLKMAADGEVAVRGEAIFQLGLNVDKSAEIDRVLLEALTDQDAWVRRRACEALVKRQVSVSWEALAPVLQSTDRYESFAARRLLESQPTRTWREQALLSDQVRLFAPGAVALMIVEPTDEHAQAVLLRCQELMRGFVNDQDFVDLLRTMQVALHRRPLPLNQLTDLKDQLTEEFPASDVVINRELIRLLAFLQVDTIPERYLEYLSSDLPVAERIHAAMYLARITTGWSPEQRLAMMDTLEIPDDVGNSVPGYLQRAAMQFGESLDEEQFAEIIENGEEHPAAALTVLLRLPSPLSEEHLGWIQQLDDRIRAEDSERFKRLKVAILAVLARDGGDGAMAYLREVYQRDPARRVEAAVGLAQRPDGANWPVLIESIPLLDGPLAQEVLQKLCEVKRTPTDAEAFRQVILCGLKLGDAGADQAVRLLEHWQGFTPDAEKKVTWDRALKAWQRWFAETYPDAPPAVLSVSTQNNKWDYAALLKHLTNDESRRKGSAERGALVFKSARCAECHRFGDVGESMGPDLTSVNRRFLTKEILDSVIYPSKIISDQYAAKTVTTTQGQVHTGIVAQGATDITVLGADGKKVRIPQAEVDEIQPSVVSAMPEGLLNGLTLEQVTDLFEYLQSGSARMAQGKDHSR